MTATDLRTARPRPSDIVVLSLPGDGPHDALLQADRLPMVEVLLRSLRRRPLIAGVVDFPLDVAHQPVGLATQAQYEIRDRLDVMICLAGDVVDSSGFEAFRNNRQSTTRIVDIG